MFYILWVFRDKLSWIVFILTFSLGLLVFVFNGNPFEETLRENFSLLRFLLGTLYSLLFALISTCLFKTIKEKFIERIKHKKGNFFKASGELFSRGAYGTAILQFLRGLLEVFIILIGVLGFGAAQFCTFGSPVCVASVGTAVVTAILPGAFVSFLFEYGNWIISIGIMLQLAGLFLMGCFKKVTVLSSNQF